MFKTISAALIAASVIAAPAFAAEAGKTTATAPVIKADQTQSKVSTTAAKPNPGVKADAKTADVKSEAKVDTKTTAMNANAKMGRHHHKHVRHYHHTRHHKMGALKTHTKVSFKRAPHTVIKRG